KNQMRNSHGLNRLFAGQLSSAIDVQGPSRIVFGVRAGLATVKNIVSGIVDQRRTNLVGFFRQDTGALSIDRVSEFRLVFRLIHGSVSSSIHDQIGPNPRDSSTNGQ